MSQEPSCDASTAAKKEFHMARHCKSARPFVSKLSLIPKRRFNSDGKEKHMETAYEVQIKKHWMSAFYTQRIFYRWGKVGHLKTVIFGSFYWHLFIYFSLGKTSACS